MAAALIYAALILAFLIPALNGYKAGGGKGK